MPFIDRMHTRSYYRIAASFFFFVQGLTFASWASRIPDVKSSLGLSDAAFGAVLFAMPAGQFITMAFSAFFVSKYGSKKILLASALLYPAVLIGLGMVTTTFHLVIGLLLFGITGNFTNIAINTQGIGVQRLYGRSIMGTFHGIWSLAGFIGGLLSTLIVSLEIIPLWHFSIIYLCSLVVFLMFKGALLPRDVRSTAVVKAGRIFSKPDRFIGLLGLIVFSGLVCEGVMFNWSNIYFKDVIKPSEAQVRLGYVGFMLTMAIGRLMADRIANQFGILKVLKAGSIIVCVGLLCAVLFPNLIMATIGFLLVGLGSSALVPLCYGLVGKSTKLLPGIALATVSTIGFMGFLVGPPLVGFISEVLSMQWAFGIIAILSLTTYILAPKLEPYIKGN